MKHAPAQSESSACQEYRAAFYGKFTGIKHWHELDKLFARLTQNADDNWYIMEDQAEVVTTPLSRKAVGDFLSIAGDYLHKEHDETYCGIVYVDDIHQPTFIKIYDPHNLGVVCGFSDNPPLPKWTLSRIPPCSLYKDKPKKWNQWLMRLNPKNMLNH